MKKELKYPICDFASIIRYNSGYVIPVDEPCYCSKAKYAVSIPQMSPNFIWFLCTECMNQLKDQYESTGIAILHTDIFDFDYSKLKDNKQENKDLSSKIPMVGSSVDGQTTKKEK